MGGSVFGYCAKDLPSTICGHPKFENPFNLIFLEVEPVDPTDYTKFEDGTFCFQEMRIIRIIEFDELRKLDSSFDQRCTYFEKQKEIDDNKKSNKLALVIKWLLSCIHLK
ncbi:hypothetical protein [Paenibacillus polymyxa]|uniref:hypothetical protein n=1 Tax=Paenibacillus polymyxa TaxID=1406 RepID=UPI0004DEFA9C|nr:hypothetical protein [Paenibacillus polymyxa]